MYRRSYCVYRKTTCYGYAVSKRTGPTVFPLKSEPFIPSMGNFQGIIFHPRMVYHINFTIISYKLWKCKQFEKKWENRETMFKSTKSTLFSKSNFSWSFWISTILIEIQSRTIASKKQKFLGFYLITGLSKSYHYFSRNLPESKFGLCINVHNRWTLQHFFGEYKYSKKSKNHIFGPISMFPVGKWSEVLKF